MSITKDPEYICINAQRVAELEASGADARFGIPSKYPKPPQVEEKEIKDYLTAIKHGVNLTEADKKRLHELAIACGWVEANKITPKGLDRLRKGANG